MNTNEEKETEKIENMEVENNIEKEKNMDTTREKPHEYVLHLNILYHYLIL